MNSVALIQQNDRRLATLSSAQYVARALAWLVAAVTMLNALYFVLRVSSPVIQADAWYFLDVFLRKAINGGLSLGDFFIKRVGADHAQPLFKLEMLLEWRYFDLDFVVGAVIGVIAAAACAVIFYRISVAERHQDRGDIARCLAWASICAVLFSLNGTGATWTWPLVALENVTTLIILVFMLVVWHAHRSKRYLALAMATLLLGITCDDSALVAVIAVVFALLLAQLCDPAQRHPSTWKILAVIGVCMVFVRIGYAYAPIFGGQRSTPISSNWGPLLDRFRENGWWKWIVLPLVIPVSYQIPLRFTQAETWMVLQIIIAALLLVAHFLFWRKAFRSKYNLAIFVAISLMVVSYGWVAGIILGRVATFGNDYVNQPRYILLYAGHLIALLLMWAEPPQATLQPSKWRYVMGIWVPASACLILLLVQIPLSIDAWHKQPYQWAYDALMATQIDQIVRDPSQVTDCLPEEHSVCNLAPGKRLQLIQLLSGNRLNIFSPQVQRRHHYLPPLSPIPAESMNTQAQ